MLGNKIEQSFKFLRKQFFAVAYFRDEFKIALLCRDINAGRNDRPGEGPTPDLIKTADQPTD